MATEVRDRRERFRQFTAQLKTGTKPVDSVHDSMLVPVYNAELERLASRLDLQPQSSHLVVGGIGTGKTTQSLIAARKLNELPDFRAIYIDVSRHHDLARLSSGVLVVVAGFTLATLVGADDPTAMETTLLR